MQNWQHVKQTFQQIWGHEEFRPSQAQIIQCLLAGKDALVVMPTGGGKSICFQLPALLQPGLTLVVSPLVALMENQVQELHQKNLAAQVLHSQISKVQRNQTLSALAKGHLRLLYLSPESLFTAPVWSRLIAPELQINSLILDEAHCLVQWGETFRPSYRRLGAVRPALLQHKPKGSRLAIAAFTATADAQAQAIITTTLKLHKPERILLNPYRQNLFLSSRTIWTPRGKRQQLHLFLQKHLQQSGLIYVRSRRDSESLAQELQKEGYKTAAYHGGFSPQLRRQREQQWLENQLQFVICTNAFGMGINKPDVRWIAHYQTPSLLAEYVQEIGRAGRDGKPSYALSLISEPTGWLNPEDKQRHEFFLQSLQKNIRQAQRFAPKLPLTGNINDLSHDKADFSLAILHSTGQLHWRDPFHFTRTTTLDKKRFDDLIQQQTRHFQQMQQFWQQKGCRWRFILQSFGFKSEAETFYCGHCDRCTQ